MLGYRLTFTGMNGTQNGVAVNQIMEAIEDAWATSWVNVVTDMNPIIVQPLASIAADTYVFG